MVLAHRRQEPRRLASHSVNLTVIFLTYHSGSGVVCLQLCITHTQKKECHMTTRKRAPAKRTSVDRTALVPAHAPDGCRICRMQTYDI